jgi:hypothetical protein
MALCPPNCDFIRPSSALDERCVHCLVDPIFELALKDFLHLILGHTRLGIEESSWLIWIEVDDNIVLLQILAEILDHLVLDEELIRIVK